MKKILMALAIMALAYTGAEAQYCKTGKTVKHKTATVRHKKATTTATVGLCRSVPYEVCKIQPGGRSVSCYKTSDLENLTPLPYETTYYGPSGKMPGEPEKQTMETVVIPAEQVGDNCRRELASNTTVCTYNERHLTRDAWGYYHYR